MPAFVDPLQANVVEHDVFVSAPDGTGEVWMTPEAVLASLEPLRQAAEEALERRELALLSRAERRA